MNQNDVENFRPMNDDVLLEHFDANKLSGNLIYMIEDDTEHKYQYYKVVKTGPKCQAVSIGDTILMHWANMTPPFEIDGRKYAVTSEQEVHAIVEE